MKVPEDFYEEFEEFEEKAQKEAYEKQREYYDRWWSEYDYSRRVGDPFMEKTATENLKKRASRHGPGYEYWNKKYEQARKRNDKTGQKIAADQMTHESNKDRESWAEGFFRDFGPK